MAWGSGCPNCGTYKKPVNGECPECGRESDAEKKISELCRAKPARRATPEEINEIRKQKERIDNSSLDELIGRFKARGGDEDREGHEKRR